MRQREGWQILLAAGANMEVRDEDGGLPLHDACAGGKIFSVVSTGVS